MASVSLIFFWGLALTTLRKAAPTKFEAELPTSEMYILVARDAP
jgi:hypothetical protein